MIDVGELYRAHASELHRFLLFLSADKALAEDLVSETFIRLWSARDRVDLATVRGYLFTIARNLFLHERRGRRLATEIDPQLADLGPGPERRAVARGELDAVLAALQGLPEPDRAALLMRAHEGLAYEEIGAALGSSAAAARVRVHRARARLVATRAESQPRVPDDRSIDHDPEP